MVPQILQGALDSVITPGQVLSRNADNQISNLLTDMRTADLPTSVAVVPFLGHQLSVPPEKSVGRDNRCDFLQHLPSQDLPFDSQPSTLLVIQKDTFLSQFLLEDLVLRDQVLDDLLLLAPILLI